MNLYERHLMPRLVDWTCGCRVLRQQRRRIVPNADGLVLEVGFGSGLNLPYYDRTRVQVLWALEPSAQMRALAAARISGCGLDVRMLDQPGESVPLPDGDVDTVVVTYSLCTIPDPQAALAEMRRVLRPGGRLLFCEHGAAPDAPVRRWQDRLNGVWRKIAGGCNLNRPTAALIEGAGFRFESLQSAYLPGTPRFAGYNTWGAARPA